MATCGRKMSRFPFFWLLLVLGNLENASCLVGCLMLLKENNHPEQVGRYHLVQVSELVLVCLRLHEEDLFTLLLRCGYVHRLMEVFTKLVLVHLRLHEEEHLFTILLHRGYVHCLMEVVSLEVAEKLHLMQCELVHWHECGLLGCTKPANQLVANVGKLGNGLKVVPDALVKVSLHMICIIWALLCNDAGPLDHAYILKGLTQEAKQQWTIVLLRI